MTTQFGNISAENLWSLRDKMDLVDVRSPSEYHHGHIPGAVNIPLFSDEERSVVGTTYKQKGQNTAIRVGLDFAGAKMSTYLSQYREMCGKKGAIVYCWRGGKRSESLSWLLGFAGHRVMRLEGGYKQYRAYCRTKWTLKPYRLVIVGGRTGSGKTEVLHALRDAGEQILDLEALARHKGSAFGNLGNRMQPTVEQFENDLYEELRALNSNRVIWIENESKSIGKVYVPDGFWAQMKAAPLINLDKSFEARCLHLIDTYGKMPAENLRDAFLRIQKRLGGQNLKIALEAIEQGDLQDAAGIALAYYDKAYQYNLDKNISPHIHYYPADDSGAEQTAQGLMDMLNKHETLWFN